MSAEILQFDNSDALKLQRLSERAKQLIDTLLRVPVDIYEEADFLFNREREEDFFGTKDGWAIQFADGRSIPGAIQSDLDEVIGIGGEAEIKCYGVGGGNTLDSEGNLLQKEILLVLNTDDSHPIVLTFISTGCEGIQWMDLDSAKARSVLSQETQEWILSMLNFANKTVSSLGIIPTERPQSELDQPLAQVISLTGRKAGRNML